MLIPWRLIIEKLEKRVKGKDHFCDTKVGIYKMGKMEIFPGYSLSVGTKKTEVPVVKNYILNLIKIDLDRYIAVITKISSFFQIKGSSLLLYAEGAA